VGKKKILWIIVLIVALACFLSCVGYFLIDFIHYKSITNISGAQGNASNVSSVKKEVQVPVDFEELKNVNDDIYAWIRIPYADEAGKYIADYPILQSKGEDGKSYYLNHNVNRKSSAYGSIYTQDYNNKNFNDFNTLIYGHNMKNGTMFGTLKKYRNKEFFETNREIEIYMPGRILKYKIFAAYVFDDRHIMLSFDFEEKMDREIYLDTVFSKRSLYNNFADDITVDTDDKIITLSTCTNNDSERYLVQGVLVYDSDTDS
jgi:sortase B